MKQLVINNLHVSVEGTEILKGVDLTFNQGDILALLGPNGHGKSTLFNAIMGHPRYKITEGSITADGEDVLKMSVDERSKKGIFMAFQNPPEVSGVENMDFFKQIINSHQDENIKLFDFYTKLKKGYKEVNLSEDMNTRHLNEGFSGGEKKRNEILQMLLLNPGLILLDEIDSGLDVDALQLVSKAIKAQTAKGSSFIVISHYARLYSLIKPTRAVVMVDGKIVVDGGIDIIKKVDEQGYDWIRRELGISIKKEEDKPIVLESCAHNKADK
jgi:Fe-S cluster assembly ATP-binding protein